MIAHIAINKNNISLLYTLKNEYNYDEQCMNKTLITGKNINLQK